ncbi:MAG TPA: ATP-binding cassette domain-containing protein [Gemmatimonadales bacterium]|jgi:simple sugar transport system ATP-binding protein
MNAPALELAGIHKSFGSVHALRGADFVLQYGELHALLGENGAGKTTLMRVAYGLVHPEAGRIVVAGVTRVIHSPRTARRLGVGMVHQHSTSIPALSVAENVALSAGWPVRPGKLRDRVAALGEKVGLPLDPKVYAGRLTVALKQRLEIVKALASDARILLLDEPTSVLTPGETEDLLRVLRRFTDSGGAAVLITHKLDEALRVAEGVTVLRQGQTVLSGRTSTLSQATLAEAMLGEPASRLAPVTRQPIGAGDSLVRVEALEVPRESGYGIAVRHASLVVRQGEVLGMAAVEGNGQRELLRAVAGRLVPLRGRLEVASPVAFVPEDRSTEGLIPAFSLTENVVLGSDPSDRWLRRGRVDWRLAREHTAELLHDYEVVAGGPGDPAASLSGGNQQKLVLARELSRGPRVIVAENPTRGLDVRATLAIHNRLRAAAARGAAVLVYCSDLDELLSLADRFVVVARGALIDVPPAASRYQIGELMVTGAR